jgi:hypothetical protein
MGLIVELRHPDGTPPYVVRWSDTGREALYFPKAGGRVAPESDFVAEPVPAPEGAPVRLVKTWSVELHVVADGHDTLARAILHEDPESGVVACVGRATRSADDPDIPEIGDEVAVARALRQLSDTLLRFAGAELAEREQLAADPTTLPEAAAVDIR